ncbi:MAG: restriction endonuclease [Phycisphaeraceae bacterium]
MTWMPAEVTKLRHRRLLDCQQGLDTIRALTWRQFEQLVAEAYRRRGYSVEVVDRPAGDGGVDVVLSDDRGRWLAQCKHWQARRVGVRPVRELLGVVTSEGAAGGIVVTTGSFTPDAQAFARDNAVELVDGAELADLVQEARQPADEPTTTPAEPTAPAAEPAPPAAASADDATTAPACPACGSPMVRRTARRGEHAGSAFWGCSTFPRCRGTRSEAAPAASAT